MTEKRFTIADYPTDIIDNQSGKKYPCSSYGTHMEIICDLLNEQHEQIERLKRNFRALDKVKCELADENEQLKKQIERIDFILDDLNGAEYISRDDGIKALNKIDKVIGKR